MTDYGRKPKDYDERYEVRVVNHDGGWASFDVVSVGRAYSPATWAVSPEGAVFSRVNAEDDVPAAAGAMKSAEAQAMALSMKRYDARDSQGTGRR